MDNTTCRFCLRTNNWDDFFSISEEIKNDFENFTHVELKLLPKKPNTVCTFCLRYLQSIVKYKKQLIENQQQFYVENDEAGASHVSDLTIDQNAAKKVNERSVNKVEKSSSNKNSRKVLNIIRKQLEIKMEIGAENTAEFAEKPPIEDKVESSENEPKIRPQIAMRRNSLSDAQVKIRSYQRCNQYLVHAYECSDTKCTMSSCQRFKRFVDHSKNCNVKNLLNECALCKQLKSLCVYHIKNCYKINCAVPNCGSFKRTFKTEKSKTQQHTPLSKHQNSIMEINENKSSSANKNIKKSTSGIKNQKELTTSNSPMKNKVFECSDCKKQFSTQKNFEIHLKISTNRIFECDKCGAKFHTKYSINSHNVQSHMHHLFNCQECGKGFISKKSLSGHKRTVHRNKRCICTLCNKVYKSRNNCMYHLKTQHSGIEKEFGNFIRSIYVEIDPEKL